jgi:DNA primase
LILPENRSARRTGFGDSGKLYRDLIERSDIIDVVSSYVGLSRRRRIRGLVPLHNERTPSFYVSADRQVYHCFGCGAGGGVVNFIMSIENLG